MARERWLADDLVSSYLQMPGSPERDQLAALMGEATLFRLGDDVAAAVADTLLLRPETVEALAGRAVLRSGATWIEYSHRSRAATAGADPGPAAGNVPDTVGCLVAWDPLQPSRAVVFVAWNLADRTVRHSYALLHWNLERFAALSSASRRENPSGAARRLTEALVVSMSPGFMSEMLIWQEIPSHDTDRIDAAVLLTQREAAGEHLFLLAAVLMLGTSAVVETSAEGAEGPGRHLDVALAPPGRRLPWSRGGFGSLLFGGRVTWTPPMGGAPVSGIPS